ncbi:MAG: hypothetical protein MUC49_18675 [Raineya sp.]|nr:hypothetical protein [Raineya sp.]
MGVLLKYTLLIYKELLIQIIAMIHEKFIYNNFESDVEIIISDEQIDVEDNPQRSVYINRKEKIVLARFFNKNQEHKAEKTGDYVYISPDYGFMNIKIKFVEEYPYYQETPQMNHSVAFISGFLDEKFFIDENMVKKAVYFVWDNIFGLLPKEYRDVAFYYHISMTKTTNHIEYTGE